MAGTAQEDNTHTETWEQRRRGPWPRQHRLCCAFHERRSQPLGVMASKEDRADQHAQVEVTGTRGQPMTRLLLCFYGITGSWECEAVVGSASQDPDPTSRGRRVASGSSQHSLCPCPGGSCHVGTGQACRPHPSLTLRGTGCGLPGHLTSAVFIPG